MSSSAFEKLSALFGPLREAWPHLFDGVLTLSSERDNAGTVCVPILHEAAAVGWLNAVVAVENEAPATALLESWAGLLSGFLAENRIADRLTEELIVAWNRQTFLISAIALMRITTDFDERSLKSLQLAVQALRSESAFIALERTDGLRVNWVGPEIWGGEIRKVVDVLRDQHGKVMSNDPEGCRAALGDVGRAQSFLGQECVTLESEAVFVGLINHVRGQFNAGDVQMFESLVEMIKTFAELHALHIQQHEAEKVNRDLSIAVEIQSSFLPSQLPHLADFDLAMAMIPATRLGGDFYDVIACGPDRLAIVVADVAGKGIPAALLAAELRAILRSRVRELPTPGEVLQRVNAELFGDMERTDRFATAMLVSVPLNGGDLSYASAGHTTALHVSAPSAAVSRIASTSLPLGILPALDARSETFRFEPQDLLLVYSDGLTETEDPKGRLFGMDRVAQMLVAIHHAPAQFILNCLVDTAGQHRQSAPQSDDLTLVVVKKALPVDPPLCLDHIHLAGGLASLSQLERIRDTLRDHLPRGDQVETWLYKVELAVTEAVSNIIRHSYQDTDGDVDGLVALYADRLEIDLVDSGVPHPLPSTAPAEFDSEDLPEGGYGLGIIQSVMDTVDYQRLPDGYNLLRMACSVPS